MSFGIKPAKVAIVIPALNESEAITAVVTGISVYGKAIVVDDGSTDDTGQLARTAGALVVTHEVNRGYDAALASGLAKAVTEGFDFAITVDGDGQHDPARLENVLRELLGGADLVVGVRDRLQRVSEKLFARVSGAVWGISDPLCGMKGYNLTKLKAIDCLCSYPSIGTELAIRAARSGWDIRQVPVATRERKGVSRFGSGFYANWLIFRAMLLSFVRARAYPHAGNR
ncbi:MAG: glycosyltransferase family 2 protein [Magnetococcus sp. THC-1_WYH]